MPACLIVGGMAVVAGCSVIWALTPKKLDP